MRDISKKLSIINTGERKKSSETSVTTQYISGGGVSIGSGAFLPKSTWDKVFEIRTTDSGEEYLFGKLNLALQYGLTTFVDGKQIELPDIYDGLRIDNQTIYWAEVSDEKGNVTKVLKAKGGGTGGEGTINNVIVNGDGNALTSVSLSSDGTGLVFDKGKTFIEQAYLDENFYKKDEIDNKFFKTEDAGGIFVTLDETQQEILGVKTFKNGLNIGSSKIWQSQDDVVYIDANLVVRGGVTMYGLNKVDIPTIMAGVAVDEETISKKNGYLEVIGGGGGSIEYPLSWSGFSSGSWDGSSAKTIYIPSKVSELTNDSKYVAQSALSTYLEDYLPLSGGTLTGTLTAEDIVAEEISGGGGNLYIGNSNNSAYVYLNEDMRSASNHWSISKNGAASFSSLKVDGTSVSPDNYITSIDNVQATVGDATIDRYLGVTKGGATTNLTVGYAKHSELLKAYGVSDLSTNAAWNTSNGLKCSSFSASASNVPTSAGSNANSLISVMPTWNYGFQIACLNSLSSGYDTIPHLYFRNLVNGSYKSWYKIVTNGPQMTFEGVDWSNPYFRIRYQSNDWYYIRALSDGIYIGSSTDNSFRINASGVSYFKNIVYINQSTWDGGLRINRTLEGGGAAISVYSNGTYIGCWGISGAKRFEFSPVVDGTSTIRFHVDSSGNGLFYGGVTMYGTSDKRLKKNIRKFNASQELMSLGGVYQFEYNDEEIKRNESYKGTHIGLIYQNVKGTILDKMCYQREDGFGSLNYLDTSFISLLAAVGIEHETRLQKLERENEELKKEVEQLKNR